MGAHRSSRVGGRSHDACQTYGTRGVRGRAIGVVGGDSEEGSGEFWERLAVGVRYTRVQWCAAETEGWKMRRAAWTGGERKRTMTTEAPGK